MLFATQLREAPLNGVNLSENGLVVDAGVVTLASTNGNGLDEFTTSLAAAIAEHRHFDRNLEAVPA